MKKLILSTAALAAVAVGGIAIAQSGRMAPPSTKAEATAQAAERFAKLDADKNGQITQAEMSAAHEARKAKRAERMAAKGKEMPERAGRPDRAAKMMERQDTNSDGQISLSEMTAQAMARFDRVDANKDGTIDAAERTAMREKMKERRAARMGDE